LTGVVTDEVSVGHCVEQILGIGDGVAFSVENEEIVVEKRGGGWGS